MSSSGEWKCPNKRAKTEDNGGEHISIESSGDSPESSFKCLSKSKSESFQDHQNLKGESSSKENLGPNVISVANFVESHVSSKAMTCSEDSGSSVEVITEDKEILESSLKNYDLSKSKPSKQIKSESFQQDRNLSNESSGAKDLGSNLISTANFVKGPVSSTMSHSEDSGSSVDVIPEDKGTATTHCFFSGVPSSVTLPRIQISSSDEKTSPSSSDTEARSFRKMASNETYLELPGKTESDASKHGQTAPLDTHLQVESTKLSLDDSENAGCSKALNDISPHLHSNSNSFLQTDVKNRSSEKNKRSSPSVPEKESSSRLSSDDSSYENVSTVSSESSFEKISPDISFENGSPEMPGESKKKREFSPEY